MKFLVIFVVMFLAISCNNERKSAKGTVQLYIKYATEKKMDKIYELLTPESKKNYMKGNEYLIRSDFQVNRYNVKAIRLSKKDKDTGLYYMGIYLKDESVGYVTLRKIDDEFYIKLD